MDREEILAIAEELDSLKARLMSACGEGEEEMDEEEEMPMEEEMEPNEKSKEAPKKKDRLSVMIAMMGKKK